MLQIRPASARGHAHLSWLDSYHTFSFGEYYDPRYMGVSNLRVINDDTLAPGGGFATHAHRDMEIVSYVLSGALEHRDDLGNGSIIQAGDVQRMSAGTGVMHSEYNHSRERPVHFLQIWLKPNRVGVAPDYAQKHVPPDRRRGRLALLVSPDGRDGSLSARQDALLYGSLLEAGQAIELAVPASRRVYVHIARGGASVNGVALGGGDGACTGAGEGVHIEATRQSELLLFDLP